MARASFMASPDVASGVLEPTSGSSALPGNAHSAELPKLALGALGVVYGDIGTSPLYAVKECFTLPHGVAPTPANIYGVLSLIVWAITIVVSMKYLLFVMRADNAGEGGVVALMSLIARGDRAASPRRRTLLLVTLGLCGASLLSGEGVITPAISVLSAVEGLGVATSTFSPFVVPLTCGILVALFSIQRRGTRLAAESLPLEAFLEDVALTRPHRVPGTAVVLSSVRRGTPNALLHQFKHLRVLHEQIVILSIVTDAVPEVPVEDSVHLKRFGHGFWAVTAHCGFTESPSVTEVLRRCEPLGLRVTEANASYYLGRETLVSTRSRGMAMWRKRLFAFLSRNARAPTDFFAIPPNRVVEFGARIEL